MRSCWVILLSGPLSRPRCFAVEAVPTFLRENPSRGVRSRSWPPNGSASVRTDRCARSDVCWKLPASRDGLGRHAGSLTSNCWSPATRWPWSSLQKPSRRHRSRREESTKVPCVPRRPSCNWPSGQSYQRSPRSSWSISGRRIRQARLRKCSMSARNTPRSLSSGAIPKKPARHRW